MARIWYHHNMAGPNKSANSYYRPKVWGQSDCSLCRQPIAFIALSDAGRTASKGELANKLIGGCPE
jgi:hypothetical protein